MIQRSQIYDAVVAQIQKITAAPYLLDVPVILLGLVHWEEANVQPAIYVDPVTETPTYTRGFPIKWTLEPDIWIYAKRTATGSALPY